MPPSLCGSRGRVVCKKTLTSLAGGGGGGGHGVGHGRNDVGIDRRTRQVNAAYVRTHREKLVAVAPVDPRPFFLS